MPPEPVVVDFRHDRPLLSVAAAARRLGVTRYTVHRAIELGELQTVQLAGRCWITSASVDAAARVVAPSNACVA